MGIPTSVVTRSEVLNPKLITVRLFQFPGKRWLSNFNSPLIVGVGVAEMCRMVEFHRDFTQPDLFDEGVNNRASPTGFLAANIPEVRLSIENFLAPA